jgi:hypothetical protein
MNGLLSVSGVAVLLMVMTVAGCGGADDGRRYPVSSAGQGQIALREERVEPRPVPVRERVVEAPAPAPRGPTTREAELQRTIDSLEARQKEMQTEIERLKREKAGAK